MARPDYRGTIQRIADILMSDTELASKIAEFRFGELPEEHFANAYPAIYVTTPQNPQVSRKAVGPARGINSYPSQRIESVYWVIVVDAQATPSTVQSGLYDISVQIENILARNNQLRYPRRLVDPEDTSGNPDDLVDPKCDKHDITAVNRLTRQRGRLTDGITVILRTINHMNSPRSPIVNPPTSE